MTFQKYAQGGSRAGRAKRCLETAPHIKAVISLAMASLLTGCAITKNSGVDRPFTIAVLPDTQFYCDTRLKLSEKWGNGDLRRYFFDQTQWVRDNKNRLNIAFLVHEGDMVQADAPEEWAIAKEAMSVLEGHVPYCMCLGNHDMGFEKADNKYGGNIAVNRTTGRSTLYDCGLARYPVLLRYAA